MKKITLIVSVLIMSLIIVSCSKPSKDNSSAKVSENVNQEETKDNEQDNNEKADSKQEDEGETEVGVYPGMIAPDFTLLDRDDNEISLYDYKGKITFINFWATTCPYCVDEMPDLEEFYNRHKDEDDFALFGVNMINTWEKKSKDQLVNWIDDLGITFPIVFDEDGEQAQQWLAHSLPITYIIDKNGESLGAVMGMTNLETLEDILEQVREANK